MRQTYVFCHLKLTNAPGLIQGRCGGVRRLIAAINADTCQTLNRDKNGYVDVSKADTITGRMGMVDSCDGADASYPQSHIGLDEGDLFAGSKRSRLRIHQALFTDPARRQYATSGARED